MTKADLKSLIDQANALDEQDYTTSSWGNLTASLGNAQSVYDDPGAEQTDIDNAYTPLQNTINALEERADKTALVAVIQQANSLEEGDYTEETWSDLESSRSAAINVNNMPDASQMLVDGVTSNLSAAIDGLEETTNTTSLQASIIAAESLTETDYTSSTWEDVQTALAAGQAVNGKADPSQTEVDDAQNALDAAIAALVDRADFSSLQAALTDAQSVSDTGWSAESYSEFTASLTAADSVLSDSNSSQAAVDAAARNIRYTKALLMSTEGCQLPFNSEGRDLSHIFNLPGASSPDSTQRRLRVQALGGGENPYQKVMYTDSADEIPVDQPWGLAGRFMHDLPGPGTRTEFYVMVHDGETDETLAVLFTTNEANTVRPGVMVGADPIFPNNTSIPKDLEFGTSFSLSHNAGDITFTVAGEELASASLPETTTSVRVLVAIFLSREDDDGALYTLDILTNENTPSVCAAMFKDEEGLPRQMDAIRAALSGYGHALAPGKTVSPRVIIRHHLSLSFAFRAAKRHDERHGGTEAMDVVLGHFDKETVSAFSPLYTGRFLSSMKTLHLEETNFYMESLKAAYQEKEIPLPDWLKCPSEKLTDCLPESLTSKNLDYLNHV